MKPKVILHVEKQIELLQLHMSGFG